jgi:hypothetical protein
VTLIAQGSVKTREILVHIKSMVCFPWLNKQHHHEGLHLPRIHAVLETHAHDKLFQKALVQGVEFVTQLHSIDTPWSTVDVLAQG